MIPGVPSMLIHILRCLRTIPKAPVTIGMTDTLLQFQIIIIIIIITKLHFFLLYHFRATPTLCSFNVVNN